MVSDIAMMILFLVGASIISMDYVKNLDLCRGLSLLLVVCTQKVEEFTTPVDGDYKLECWGSQGGTLQSFHVPGYGGYSVGWYKSTANRILYICVGNHGAYGSYSYNNNIGANIVSGVPGGGATHISINSGGELKEFDKHRGDVLLVAGGGGCCDMTSDVKSGIGGQGGGKNGTAGSNSGSLYYPNGDGTGATDVAGGKTSYYSSGAFHIDGSFGLGGVASNGDYGAQGGSGWFGGGGCELAGTSGGGSAYINPILKSVNTINGNNLMPNPQGGSDVIGHLGDGICVISWILK